MHFHYMYLSDIISRFNIATLKDLQDGLLSATLNSFTAFVFFPLIYLLTGIIHNKCKAFQGIDLFQTGTTGTFCAPNNVDFRNGTF